MTSRGPRQAHLEGFDLHANVCAVLGEFAEVSARVSTRIPEWHTLEGKPVPVDAPDSINVVGRLVGGGEVTVNVAAVPSNSGGN